MKHDQHTSDWSPLHGLDRSIGCYLESNINHKTQFSGLHHSAGNEKQRMKGDMKVDVWESPRHLKEQIIKKRYAFS